MRSTLLLALAAVACLTQAARAQRPQLSLAVRQYVAVDSPIVVITHVRVIDGTGAPPRENQTVMLRDGKIVAVSSAPAALTASTQVIDGTGKTLLPGLVMVHEHFFYPPSVTVGPPAYIELAFSAPRLYLGAGITTARTGGSMEPYSDLSLAKWIADGQAPGPKLDVTGPYLSGVNGAPLPQFHVLADSADARRTVRYWADLGATSFKAYMWITRDELRAAVDEAHKRGLKITGHLCSVTFREAAQIGIDNLEHGLAVASDLYGARKPPDVCPISATPNPLALIDVATDTTVASVIRTLVERRVAVTSTLAVFETFVPNRGPTPQRILDAMSDAARQRYVKQRAAIDSAPNSVWTKTFANELAFEKKFADAGGLLLVGTDPTGYGGVIPGLSSQRAIELLVEAGFTPVQAIRIATLNGATYLGRADRVGTIAVGKDADLVLVAGNPSKQIADIEKVELVFKDGVGYDSAKLIASTRGLVGAQ